MRHLIICLLLLFSSLFIKAQTEVYIGTPTQIANQAMASKLVEAFDHIANGVADRFIKEQRLNELRSIYWKHFNQKTKIHATIAKEYFEMLRYKDLYYLSLDISGSITNPETVDVFNRLFGLGTQYDNGINKMAYGSFKKWSFSIIRDIGQSDKNFAVALRESFANDKNKALYQSYLEKRNTSEYFNKSAASPLKSSDPYLRYVALIYSLNQNSKEIYDNDISTLKKYVSLTNLKAGFEEFDNRYTTWKTKEDGIKKVHQLRVLQSLLAYKEASNKEALALVSIAQKYHCSLEIAEDIFLKRKTRYPIVTFTDALNKLHSKIGIDECNVNPDLRYYQRDKSTTISEPGTDCFGILLDRHVIGKDIKQLIKPILNKQLAKAELIKELEILNTSSMSANEIYTKMTKFLNEETLLCAYRFRHSEYGIFLHGSDQAWLGFYFAIAESIALAEKDKSSIAFLALKAQSDYPYEQLLDQNKCFSSILKAINLLESVELNILTDDIKYYRYSSYQTPLKGVFGKPSYLDDLGKELMMDYF